MTNNPLGKPWQGALKISHHEKGSEGGVKEKAQPLLKHSSKVASSEYQKKMEHI